MESREYLLGDMVLRYEINSEGNAGMLIYPASMPLPGFKKRSGLDPLLHVKLSGDSSDGNFSQGMTMRGSESAFRLKFSGQEERFEGHQHLIITTLSDPRGYKAEHCVSYTEGDSFLTVSSSFKNESEKPVKLEMITSFSLEGLSPYLPDDGPGAMRIHRLQSRWSQEGRLKTETLEELQLEPAWSYGAARSERFGQSGSMPVNHYFPFIALEDTRNYVFWGAQLSVEASWQLEVYRKDEAVAISGGLADREFGHWMKTLQPGESLETPLSILSVANTSSLDLFSSRLTAYGERFVEEGPESERDLPIIFNEFCTTWGSPSHENISAILKAIRGKGISYFVIDCGWYRKDSVNWMVSMGDYNPSETLFPEGISKTVELIHSEGCKAGIWFEIENIGHEAEAFKLESHQLKRDGKPLTTKTRRFWDMNDPWVREYLHKKVTGFLKENSFDYLKIDYNDTIGIGVDDPDSLGEGLRKNIEGTVSFISELKEQLPGLVLETCASGGHRLEPGFLSMSSMASFSDAHECVEIPIIASNLHRVLLPRQSQIWAVIRETDSLKRICYSVAATFLGRMCLSGDVTNLTSEQWDAIERGIAFYKEIRGIIKKGQTYHQTPEIVNMRHPELWQGVVRIGEDGEAFALVHAFAGDVPQTIHLQLPDNSPDEIVSVYSDIDIKAEVKDNCLSISPVENFRAVAVHLRKRS